MEGCTRFIKKIAWWSATISCVVVVVCGSTIMINHYRNAKNTRELYHNLAVSYEKEKNSHKYINIDEDSLKEKSFLNECKDLYEKNKDLVGWISVPDTDISYPVMQTSKDNRDYYLRRDFNKQYNIYGSIYASEDCDVFAPSDNVTLYGHHMNDGFMFAPLVGYSDYEFWEKHQTIIFDTLYEHHTYQVFSVFKLEASNSFRYHLFTNAGDESEFNSFISSIKEFELYDTGIDANYGDKILCLSTCEYSLNDGRFVVVAKRIS